MENEYIPTKAVAAVATDAVTTVDVGTILEYLGNERRDQKENSMMENYNKPNCSFTSNDDG